MVQKDAQRSRTRGDVWVVVVALGVGGALLGVMVGLVIGANVGGARAESFSMGSLHGYEATGILGAVVGGVVLGGLGHWLGLGRRVR